MDDTTEDPYKTPDAALVEPEGSGDILQFDRFSAWGVFFLSIITLGIYPIYWMYTRAKVINTIHESKLSSLLLISFLVISALSYITGFASGFTGNPEPESVFDGVISIIYLVLYLVVLFTIRNRLRDIIYRSGKERYNVSIVLTFLFWTIYLQYKINQCIDEYRGMK